MNADTLQNADYAPTADFPLTHGEALVVLTGLGFADGVSDMTFNYYIKSLRKLGLPFPYRGAGPRRERLARYSYCNMMELALALALRVYAVLPDPVADALIELRSDLFPIYRQAYIERRAGRGARVTVTTVGEQPFGLEGLFVDLRMTYAGGRLLRVGPPRALGPFEALRTFAERKIGPNTVLPLNLSQVAARLVDEAGSLPGRAP